MCRGSWLSSLRSTRLTMSVSTALALHERPTFSPSRTTKPLRNSISVRRPFCMSWPIDGRCAEEVRWPSLKRCSSQTRLAALARLGDRLGRQMQDLFQLIALRLPDTDCFAPEPRGEAADRLALQHL